MRNSTRRHFLIAGATLIAGAVGVQAKQETPSGAAVSVPQKRRNQWEPAKTWVFAVGVIQYPDGQAWPQEGRRDVEWIAQLKSCGVPAAQILYLQDKAATLSDTQKAFGTFLAKMPADAMLWFYFTGHGTKSTGGTGAFVLYDNNWSIPTVLSTIERRFAGKTALLFADCCYSGSLGMEAMLRAGHVSYGVLTSSLSSTVSTGAWTFTECLLAGLRGAVQIDTEDDGFIDFLELSRFAEREMAMNDGQLSTFVATNGFDARFALVPCLARGNPRLGEYIEAKSKDGKWYPGRIEQVNNGAFWVRWVGYSESENEWVSEMNTRTYIPKQLALGSKVSVEWNGKYYPAEVLAGRWGMHLVHYHGYEDFWDEWVAPNRLRPVA